METPMGVLSSSIDRVRLERAVKNLRRMVAASKAMGKVTRKWPKAECIQRIGNKRHPFLWQIWSDNKLLGTSPSPEGAWLAASKR